MRSFRGMGKVAETPLKAEAGKLKRVVCEAGSDCLFISGTARGVFFEKRWDNTRAGREREFPRTWRAEQDKQDSKRNTRASREAEESLCQARGDCFVGSVCISHARVGYPSAARSAAPPRCAGEGYPLPSASPTPPPEGREYLGAVVNKITLCRIADEVSLYPKWLLGKFI